MFNSSETDSVLTLRQVLENRGRVAIFVDGANLFRAAQHLGIEVDYAKLLERLTDGSSLRCSLFYTGFDRTNEKQQRFLGWMKRHGYQVITKDLVQLPDGSKQANLDVEIAVDMLALANSYETAVLVSGASNLTYAVNLVSYRGARVEVVCLRSMKSESLINVCDRYIDLESIKEDIQKTPDSNSTYHLGPSPNLEDEQP